MCIQKAVKCGTILKVAQMATQMATHNDRLDT